MDQTMSQTKKQKITFEEFESEFNAMLSAHGPVNFCTWDGGNDSGSYDAHSDMINLIAKYFPDYVSIIETCIENFADESLGFGSFAGDFYTSGNAKIDCDEVNFIGTSEDMEGRVSHIVSAVFNIDNDIAAYNSICIEDGNVQLYSYGNSSRYNKTDKLQDFESEIEHVISKSNLNIPYREYDIDENIEQQEDGTFVIKLDLENIEYFQNQIYNVETTKSLIESIWNQIKLL